MLLDFNTELQHVVPGKPPPEKNLNWQKFLACKMPFLSGNHQCQRTERKLDDDSKNVSLIRSEICEHQTGSLLHFMLIQH